MSIYETQTCRECGCGLEGQPGESPNLAFWHHRNTMGCLRALVARVARLEAQVMCVQTDARLHNQPLGGARG